MGEILSFFVLCSHTEILCLGENFDGMWSDDVVVCLFCLESSWLVYARQIVRCHLDLALVWISYLMEMEHLVFSGYLLLFVYWVQMEFMVNIRRAISRFWKLGIWFCLQVIKFPLNVVCFTYPILGFLPSLHRWIQLLSKIHPILMMYYMFSEQINRRKEKKVVLYRWINC